MVKGAAGLAKRTLNWMNGNRIVSIQEAVYEIEQFPLVLCSEHIQDVFINNFFKLKKAYTQKLKDPLLVYSRRTSFLGYSFSRYFYHVVVPSIKKKTKCWKGCYFKSTWITW